MNAIQPGWYKDPADIATQRWWDGDGWIGDPIPADATPPAGPPPVSIPPAASVATAPTGTGARAPETAPQPWPATSPSAPGRAPSGRGSPAHAPAGTGGAAPRGGPPPGWPGGWPPGMPYPMPAPRPHGLMLAGAGARFVARMVDILVVLVLSVIANAWFAIVFWRGFEPWLNDYRAWWGTNPTSLDGMPRPPESTLELLLLMCVVLTAVWFAYEVPATANSGQTLGKRLLGIKVVRVEADERLGFGRSLRRWIRLGLPTLFWPLCWGITAVFQVIDCLFVVIDRPLRQALHDKSARTVVVQVPRPGRPETARTPASPYESVTGGRHADPP